MKDVNNTARKKIFFIKLLTCLIVIQCSVYSARINYKSNCAMLDMFNNLIFSPGGLIRVVSISTSYMYFLYQGINDSVRVSIKQYFKKFIKWRSENAKNGGKIILSGNYFCFSGDFCIGTGRPRCRNR
jgi:hypothetical protein